MSDPIVPYLRASLGNLVQIIDDYPTQIKMMIGAETETVIHTCTINVLLTIFVQCFSLFSTTTSLLYVV